MDVTANNTRTERGETDYYTAMYGSNREGQPEYSPATMQGAVETRTKEAIELNVYEPCIIL